MGRRSHGATSVVAVWVLWCLSACHGGLSWNNSVTLSVSDYNDAIGKAILFFDGQRSGKLPTSQRVQWRADSALADGSPENVDLAGGYYDAGDNVKFTGPMSFAVSLLSWTAIDYQPGISSIGQLGFLQTAIRWGTDFLLKAHTSPTTLYTQVGDGNSDHQCWERPEDMDTRRTLYKITANSPGSEAAGDAAAALAAASIVFKGVDPGYSSNLLSSARSLFEFADKYRGSYQGSCPFYCSYSGYQVINFILHTMDPSNLVMRKTCLHSSMATLKEVARVLPMVALNETSTRLAVGDAIGEINNASIRVYDMQSVAKIKVLDASAPLALPSLLVGASGMAITNVISALSFSPDGEGLVAFSEHGLMIRWWSLGSGWWEKLSRNYVPVQCTKLIFVPPWEGFSPKTARTSVMANIMGPDGHITPKENSKGGNEGDNLKYLIHNLDISYRLEWVGDRKVLLTRHGQDLGTFQL